MKNKKNLNIETKQEKELDINSFNEINELILKGNLHNVDLTIKDITNQEIKTIGESKKAYQKVK